MTIQLRDYQTEAVNAVADAWADGTDRPAVVLPTGTGKTVIFSELARREREQGGRTLVLAHRDELIGQAVAKLAAVDPGAKIGVVKAERNEVDAPIVVASVPSLIRQSRREALGHFSAGIVDEAHHATARTYRTVMDGLSIPWAGFTATMARGDGSKLGDVWSKIVYEADIISMIRRGFLVDPKGIRIKVPHLDLSGVRRTGGDYNEADLGEALTESFAPEVVADAYIEHAAGRPALLFAPTVETAQLFHQHMIDKGVRSAVVWGAMPLADRRAALADFDAGKIDVLCNCMVLTEGYDSPRAEVCIIARPTQSKPLYVQMVGRVLRPYPGKTGALVLDVVGVTGRMALCSLTTLVGKEDEAKDGQSLLEAVAEDEEAREAIAEQLYTGPTEAAEVDLFGNSRQTWLRTRAGFWFLQAGERFIALVPLADGSFNVGWWSKSGYAKGADRGGWIAQNVPDLGYAMAHGESNVTMAEQVITAKERQWRKRKPSEKQNGYARSLGFTPLPEMRSGEVSDLISVGLASERLDAKLTRWLG